MKKIYIASILIISFLIFPLFTYTLAVEMSAGVSTWYAKWVFTDSKNMEMDPAFMYGPALSLRFTDNWSIAGVFLYGRFTQEESRSGDPGKMSRYDSDLSLNYNFNRYFKIFGGAKFLAFTWENEGTTYKHWSAGPGLGLGATLPITSNIFFLLNVSGTYNRGKHEDRDMDKNITESGVNTTAAFAYYIASASSSINLGFRYQYIYIDYDKEEHNSDEGMYFYGITLSAVYTF